ncbi:MAG TPA: hypothetical protein VEY92_03485, partial [Pseudoxanthomonas sp.]|nr:hypothetical protein [Pseudoxanthomonas sp.]
SENGAHPCAPPCGFYPACLPDLTENGDSKSQHEAKAKDNAKPKLKRQAKAKAKDKAKDKAKAKA